MMKKKLDNEKGNIALFVLGMLGIIMILFTLVINLGAALATKEKSATTAQQASMVASSVLYEEVRQVIYDYEDDTLEGVLQAFFEDIEEKVDDKATVLSGQTQYSTWSWNEIELEAFDIVLTNELQHPVIRSKLHDLLADENIEAAVINKVKDAIQHNGGVLDEARLYIRNDRFYVRAANKMEFVSFDGIAEGIEESVFEEAAGPRINFLDIVWDASSTIQLD